MRLSQNFWILILAACLAGCGGEGGPSREAAVAEPTESSPSSASPASGGSAFGGMGNAKVSGTALFTGTVPPPQRSAVKSFSECAIHHPGEVYTEDVLVKDGKLQNVFVYVKEGLPLPAGQAGAGSFPLKSPAAVLDQKGCIYAPHVMGVQTGQEVAIKNSDVSLHNVHSHSAANKAFNVGMPVQGMTVKKKFDSPEIMVKLTCDVHPWMKSYIGVVAHPFFAVSDAEGNFVLENLPAGTYVIEAWHETYGTQTQSVTVADGQTQTASFTFSS